MSPLTVSVPTSNLRRAFEFYRDGLGFSLAVPAPPDAMPEPVVFAVSGTHFMLVPNVGFGWVLAGNTIAPQGTSECVFGLAPASPAEVDAVVERARAAGATVVSSPAKQPWGYAGTFRDPDGHTWMVVAR